MNAEVYMMPDCPCIGQGVVHSVFTHTANLMLITSSNRMLTIIQSCFPRVPDSICVPKEWWGCYMIGEPFTLSDDRLTVGAWSVVLERRYDWTGRISPGIGMLQTEYIAQLLKISEQVGCGLLSLPPHFQARVKDALCSDEAERYVGLGQGLTPSYDDALVGVMAVKRLLGKRIPFVLTPTVWNQTTEISARYLRLAQKGYFGELIWNLAYALCGKGDVIDAIGQLLQIGATSGRDILFGMAQALHTEQD